MIDDAPLPPLPARDPEGHKGTFGTVCVVGGCALRESRMFGAPALAARAALRAGAGLAKFTVPSPVLDSAVALTPSATARGLPTDDDGRLIAHEAAEVFDTAASDADAIVIGPGFGPSHAGAASLTIRALAHAECPVVADADALNALAETPDFWLDLRAAAVFTPHPGEFRRLAEPLRLRGDPTDQSDRPALAAAMAQRLGVILVLKGAHTVVSDGLRTWVCERGHPCLATAGTGDVLAGLIGGLAAQFVAPGPRSVGGVELPRPAKKPLDLYDATRLGVQAHAIAGEAWARDHDATGGLLAEELADALPGVLESLRS
jgi:ADP-dependent NAD(P)H-hydrate dehydratase